MTGGGKKATQHITVSRWGAIDAMAHVLVDKNAQTQVLIGGRPGLLDPVVIQFLPLWEAGRGLEHPAGTKETNRAGEVNVQMEVCAQPGRSMTKTAANTDPSEHMSTLFDLPDVGPHHLLALHPELAEQEGVTISEQARDAAARVFRDGVASWDDDTYKALGNLWCLIAHRTGIPRKLARQFTNTQRFTADEWIAVAGLEGHMHAPNQPSGHGDPTAAFDGPVCLRRWATAPNKF
jgi:hypothetical protein